MPPGVSSRGIKGGGGGGGGGKNQRLAKKHGGGVFGASTGGQDAAAGLLGLLAIVGGPLGIAAALIGFGIGAVAGLRAKSEVEKLQIERMSRITKMMVQADVDAKIEQDAIGRAETKAIGQARVFSETQENTALDLRMAEDIAAEGARQTWAVEETNKRTLEAMQQAKEDISTDLRSQPRPIVTAVQAALDLGEAANVLSGSIIRAVAAANDENRQQDRDTAIFAINQSAESGLRIQLDTQGLIQSLIRARSRKDSDDLFRAGGGNPFKLNLNFADPN